MYLGPCKSIGIEEGMFSSAKQYLDRRYNNSTDAPSASQTEEILDTQLNETDPDDEAIKCENEKIECSVGRFILATILLETWKKNL